MKGRHGHSAVLVPSLLQSFPHIFDLGKDRRSFSSEFHEQRFTRQQIFAYELWTTGWMTFFRGQERRNPYTVSIHTAHVSDVDLSTFLIYPYPCFIPFHGFSIIFLRFSATRTLQLARSSFECRPFDWTNDAKDSETKSSPYSSSKGRKKKRHSRNLSDKGLETGRTKKMMDTWKKKSAVTRIRTWVIAATTQCTNHYTITASHATTRCSSRKK